MFTPSNMLLKYLNTRPRDIYDIVGALEGYINADPKFRTNDFMDAVSFVLSNGVSSEDLFQGFNPDIEFIEDESKWDYKYYSLARVYLKDNFCEKRITHVKAIAEKLYPLPSSDRAAAQFDQPKAVRNVDSGRQLPQPPARKNGGLQESGKKSQGQTEQKNYQITPLPLLVKIGGMMMLGAVLVLLIVSIIRLAKVW